MNRRRFQPRVAVELETVSLRLPVQVVRAVEQYAKYLGGSSDRTYVITQAIEIALQQDAEFQKTLNETPASSAAGLARATAWPAVPNQQESTDTPAGAQPALPASSRHTPVFTLTLSAPHGGPSFFPLQ